MCVSVEECVCVWGGEGDEGVWVGIRWCVSVWVWRSMSANVKVCKLLMYACPLQESRRVVLGSSEKTRYSHRLANIPQSHAVILIVFTARIHLSCHCLLPPT